MESNSTAILIKIKLRHSLGRPSRSDFVQFGFASMGIKGAAIATLISQLFNLVFIVAGFILCIRKDGDRPVLDLHFRMITMKD